MSKKKHSSLDWLVAARGYAMFGVFAGHVIMSFSYEHGYHQLNAIGQYFDPTVIPFFVFLTGAFYSRSGNGFADYARLKFGQRILPVYFYLLLVIPFYFLLPLPEKTAWDSLRFAPMYLLGIPWLSWPSWFLVALFSAELLYYFIQPHASSRWRALLFALVCYTLGWLYNHYKFDSPAVFMLGMIWMIHACLPFCALFLLGQIARPYLLRMGRWPAHQVLLTGVLAAVVCWLGVENNSFRSLPENSALSRFIPDDMISNFSGQYGHYLWFVFSSLGGVVALTCLCRLIPVNRFMRACGDHSLVLLGLNGIFQNVLNYRITGLLASLHDSVSWLLLSSVLLAAVSMALCLPVAIVLEKYLPQLTGRPMLKGPLLPALYHKRSR